MPAIGATRVHGGVGAEGVNNGVSGAQVGSSLAFYHIMVRSAASTNTDLRPEMASGTDGGLGLGVEAILRACPQGILAYHVADAATGNIHLITDGVNAPSAAELQTTIRALGTSVGTNGISTASTYVVKDTLFTVASS